MTSKPPPIFFVFNAVGYRSCSDGEKMIAFEFRYKATHSIPEAFAADYPDIASAISVRVARRISEDYVPRWEGTHSFWIFEPPKEQLNQDYIRALFDPGRTWQKNTNSPYVYGYISLSSSQQFCLDYWRHLQ